MTSKITGALLSLVAGTMIYGCTSSKYQNGLSLQMNSTGSIVKDKRFAVSSVLNKSPKVLIASPKSRNASGQRKSFGLGAFYSGLQEKKEREYQTDKSLESGSEADNSAGFGNFLSTSKNTEGAGNGQAHHSSGVEEEIILPVVSIAYGGDQTVVKAVNGGFGMVLLREGDRKNRFLCLELFNAMHAKTNREIEYAASHHNDLLRPTYWLDKRSVNNSTEKSNNRNRLLHLSQNKSRVTLNAKPSSKNNQFCNDKVANYDFDVSNALVKRLGLINKPGPYLAAWREDGKKAMILDLSLFHTRADFKLAVKVWMNHIVKRRNLFNSPRLWKPGIINYDAAVKKLISLGRKEGDASNIFVSSPSKEVVSVN